MDETFGELLKRLRLQADLSQWELSRRSGLSISTIVKLERDDRNGKAPISLRQNTLSMLADGLGLSMGSPASGYFFEVALKRDLKKWAFLEDQYDVCIEESHPRFLP